MIDLIRHLLPDTSVDAVMAHLTRISAVDRYQASQGIEHAATVVAEAARASGLADVTIERIPADGTERWWSFRAPVSWTPIVARLEIYSGGIKRLEVDHAKLPCTVAVHSAPVPRGGLEAPLSTLSADHTSNDVHGTVVAVGREHFDIGLPDRLAAAGALGFLTDAASGLDARDEEQPGRIELDVNSTLFAFSVTPTVLDSVRAWAARGALARVALEVDRSASMPVVSGTLPGRSGARETWLNAHLCHPRPGANDNASGVAALLGIAQVLAALSRSNRVGFARTVRFVWGPEFVGSAAVLHRHLASGASPPHALINLDMVGGEQSRCGSPFIFERPPLCPDPLFVPLAEHVVQEAFAMTAPAPGSWESVPYSGFSDHALFADPGLQCASAQLAHAYDRFNHTAADHPDNISRTEMLRAMLAGAALAQLLSSETDMSEPVLRSIVARWCDAEAAAALRIAEHHAQVDRGAWSRRLLEHVERRIRLTRDALTAPRRNAEDVPVEWKAAANDGVGLTRRWAGPFNARAMFANLPSPRREAARRLVADDKRQLALLNNLAVRVDGCRTREDIIDDSSFALRQPVKRSTAHALLDVLVESGWISEHVSPSSA